jgi:hypothetical protein
MKPYVHTSVALKRERGTLECVRHAVYRRLALIRIGVPSNPNRFRS